MRGTIRSGQSSSIQHERHGQILECDFLKDLIERSLQERTVNVDNGTDARLGLPRGEGHRVRFADPRVEEPIRKLVPHRLQLVALAHRGGQHGHPRIVAHRLPDRITSMVCVGLAASSRLRNRSTVVVDKRGRRVKIDRVGRRRMVSMAFLGHHVQQHGSVQVLDHVQVLSEDGDVVAIDRPDVTETKILEQHASVQTGFHAFFQLRQKPFRRIAQQRNFVQHANHFGLQSGIKRRGPQAIQVAGNAADPRTDGHFVVVQDNQQIRIGHGRVIHRFEDDTRREGAVADDGHRMTVVFSQQAIAASQSQRGRHTRAGMPGHEQIVFAFARIRITHQSAARADRGEFVVPPRDQLVRIDLMPRVPDEPVATKVVAAMQGEAKFHDSQIGCKMSRPRGEQIAQDVANFGGKLVQFPRRHLAQSGRRIEFA